MSRLAALGDSAATQVTPATDGLRWLAFDPVVNWRYRVDNLKQLRGILLDAGQKDDYNLHWGHRLLSHYLTEAGVPHLHTENAGNHGGRWAERYQMALEWMAGVLEHEPA